MSYEFLSYVKLNALWPDVFFALQQNQDYRWSKGAGGSKPRIPQRDSTLGEINARLSDRHVIAPIIARGSAAPLRTPNPVIRMEQENIPKIKHGVMLSETDLRTLERVQNALVGVQNLGSDDVQAFVSAETRYMSNLALGVLDRIEDMCVGLLLDTYTYAIDKGVVFSMSWGAPSDAKVTVGTNWGDGTVGISHGAASATPISDVEIYRTNLRTIYGVEFDRVSISTQGFDYILKTDEFKALAALPMYWDSLGIPPNSTALTSLTGNRKLMHGLVQNMMGMEIEFDDRQYMVEKQDLTNWAAPPAAAAAGQYVRYLPANKMVFTRKANDGNINAWDVANLPVLESMPNMVPGMIGGNPQGASRGPFTYASALSLTGDPPGKVMYSVQEAVPEKKDLFVAGVMTIY